MVETLFPTPMAVAAMFDVDAWARVPFWFWTCVFFMYGCIVGSFLNVCIYRMPIDQSIVSPPSHCPHCKYSIPWYLNMPVITWLFLKGRCANCHAPISIRYLLVELLTGLLFGATWLKYGQYSVWVSLVYCLFISGLIVATFIDFEHFMIPDRITIGGILVGLGLSLFVPNLQTTFPNMQPQPAGGISLNYSIWGAGLGGLVIYAIVRGGKLLFGRKKHMIPPDCKIRFSETGLKIGDEMVEFSELFYRKSDTIRLHAKRLELIDRCYWNVPVSLSPECLKIGEEELNPEKVPYMEVEADSIVIPREAMGLGDVKFMAAIGAFLGWPATLFSLAVSSCLGAVVGISLILMGKGEKSGRIPYGPYIAAAALIWLFGGREWTRRWLLGF